MSIENTIDSLTKAINRLADAMEAANWGVDDTPADVKPATRTKKVKDEVVSEAPASAPVVTPAPVAAAPVVEMPAPPVFEAPAPVAAAPVTEPVKKQLPFHDASSLMEYVMTAYTELGAAKGAEIQNVLITLGVAHINAVRPDQYEEFYAAVEALKG